MICPYCGSEKYELSEDGRYHCLECDMLFDDEDIKWQDLRHQISHYLIDTDEEHPVVFGPNEMPIIGESWPETYGLSTLDMPHLDRIFQIPGDGTIWYHFEGEYEKRDPTGLRWRDIEDPGFLMLDDLRQIAEALESHHIK